MKILSKSLSLSLSLSLLKTKHTIFETVKQVDFVCTTVESLSCARQTDEEKFIHHQSDHRKRERGRERSTS